MVFEKVKGIIVDQLDVDAEKVTMESNVAEDLGADSLDVVDLIMSIEEEFDMEINDDAVENMKTVGDIVGFIDSNNK
ncbi:MAG: acyl carrier protein [Clostridiales bacterium]|nr:acyl carrier protein [Clostridiales bacterium]